MLTLKIAQSLQLKIMNTMWSLEAPPHVFITHTAPEQAHKHIELRLLLFDFWRNMAKPKVSKHSGFASVSELAYALQTRCQLS